jgi:hypothetical protein
MNNTRAKSAADTSTVPATVLYSVNDKPYEVEIDGVVFKRASDQREARREAELEAIGKQLEKLAGANAKDARKLLGEFEALWANRVNDIHAFLLRKFGYVLMDNHLPQLWPFVYAQLSNYEFRYTPGEAEAFLHDADKSSSGGEWLGL